jgi:hypothetical protein
MNSSNESKNPLSSEREARLIHLSETLEVKPKSESWQQLALRLDQKLSQKNKQTKLSKWLWPISIAASCLVIVGLWQWSDHRKVETNLVIEKLAEEPSYYSNYLRVSHQLSGYTPVGEGQTKKKFTVL